MPVTDLTGKKFGRLLVLEQDKEYAIKKNIQTNKTYWKCQCDCGTIKTVRADKLTGGSTISCGCYSRERATKAGHERFHNLTGQRFGRLLVLERDDDYLKEHNLEKGVYWRCQCDCGNIVTILSSLLMGGHTTSCGCLTRPDLSGMETEYLYVLEKDNEYYDNKDICRRGQAYKCKCKTCGNIFSTVSRDIIGEHLIQGCPNCRQERRRKDITGQRFGKLVVEKFLRMDKHHESIYLCKCDCGNEVEVNRQCLIRGDTGSCGCMRSKGEFNISNLLKENHIPFETQKTFSTCCSPLSGRLLKFDFYINNSFLLEFDGFQHFGYNTTASSSWNTKEQYEKTKMFDEYKNQWAKENNIPLKRIPYWKTYTTTLEDIMSDKFLVNYE